MIQLSSSREDLGVLRDVSIELIFKWSRDAKKIAQDVIKLPIALNKHRIMVALDDDIYNCQ